MNLRNTHASKTELDMCAMRADIIIPLWEKILWTDAELASIQNTRAKSGRNRAKSAMSLSMRNSSSVIGSTAALLMTDRCAVVVLMYYVLIPMESMMLLSGSGRTGLCVSSYWLVHLQHQKCCWLHGIVVGWILLTPPAAFLWFDTISQGPNEKFKDMSRTNTQGQGRGQGQIFEDKN